ncbi:hypothetical protein PIB30_017940 [Stylosanthes scabra]|uniref:Uncharacterized protein n=1 Tax=Stylosanthes scabra TaxID=79078 RepID=A0ABU6R861_9FABA|nr:hypothetical protein [Stylosanthes scabra]
MEDLSMFQRPRTVALEDENPETYGGTFLAHIYNLFGFRYDDISLSFSRTQGNPELTLFTTPRTALINGSIPSNVVDLVQSGHVPRTCNKMYPRYYGQIKVRIPSSTIIQSTANRIDRRNRMIV